MIAGKFDFTGSFAVVQGKTFRRVMKLKDAAGDPLPVSDYHFRCKFKKDFDGPDILFLSTDTGLSGLTSGQEINYEPDDEDGNPIEGAIELYIPDETMEGILHTQWTEVVYGTPPFARYKYKGVWELEMEDKNSPGDTVPVLAGKVEFVREAAR